MVVATTASASGSSSINLRLYLIRHAETEANAKRIVAGHLETPLTGTGKQQAASLGDTVSWLREIDGNGIFHYYVSDMGRTQETAAGILGMEELPLKGSAITLEKRIREQAKGAREGQQKATLYQEALERFHAKQQQQPEGERTDVPLLEQESDVWERTKSWLNHVATQISSYHFQKTCGTPEDAAVEMNKRSIYPVVAVSHSGTIRVMCQNLVADQLPPHVTTTPADENGSTPSHLKIPNTSVTVIDLEVVAADASVNGRDAEDAGDRAWKNPSLRQLTWTVSRQEVLMGPTEE